MPIAGWVVIGIVAVLIVLIAGNYNSLVRLRNQVKNAWAQIDVQLKRRHDLIPNLVDTVKGYAAHERETLESVTNARNLAQGAIGKGVGAQSKAE
ncbi:MAG: LemA family protein, partial [Dehalococcoidia bacterium]